MIRSSDDNSSPDENGGKGEDLPRIRPSEVQTLIRSITEGWLREDKDKFKGVIAQLWDVVNSDDEQLKRQKVPALKAILNALDMARAVGEYEDKCNRLDAGALTENIGGVTFVIREAEGASDRG